MEHTNGKNRRVLLISLPYWTPLVPPQGIAYLKTYLKHNGFEVNTIDANTDVQFKELYTEYFMVLRKHVPENRRGNFYNIGHDVLRNHMIAHIHQEDKDAYMTLVKQIVYNTYFTHLDDEQAGELNALLDEFYARLRRYTLRLLQEEKPDVFGLSVSRDTIGPSLFAFRLAKEVRPDVLTVMGGCVFSDHLLKGTPNFESFLERTPYIDKIIIGEGQDLFVRLLRGELPDEQRVFTLKEDGVKTLGFSPLNTPDLSDFNIERDYPYLSAQASGSCPYQCSFCNVASFYGDYREKDPEQTVAEMKKLYETYGMQVFFMNDSLLNYVATPLSNAMAGAGLSLYWDGYLRVHEEVNNPDNTLLWRRGGMYRVRMGVESGSQAVLDAMDKRITLDDTRASLASLAEAGIKTTTYWVIGHPGETEEDFVKTLELLEETRENIYEAECNPFIYGYAGQAQTCRWQDKRELLYPENARDMLLLQSWYVNEAPSREETYKRVNRFTAHCNRLGIPNPYSQVEIYNADKRWEKLHKNAVPPLADLNDRAVYVEENKTVEKLCKMENTLDDDGDFGF